MQDPGEDARRGRGSVGFEAVGSRSEELARPNGSGFASLLAKDPPPCSYVCFQNRVESNTASCQQLQGRFDLQGEKMEASLKAQSEWNRAVSGPAAALRMTQGFRRRKDAPQRGLHRPSKHPEEWGVRGAGIQGGSSGIRWQMALYGSSIDAVFRVACEYASFRENGVQNLQHGAAAKVDGHRFRKPWLVYRQSLGLPPPPLTHTTPPGCL